MRYKNCSIPYLFSYLLFFSARKGYYRKLSKQGNHNIPKGKPVIFAINHQNSLVDPCIVATTITRPVYFLARSDVFKNPMVSKVLHSINMMPIFRRKDGSDFKERNIEIFEKCVNILSKNGSIMIFPEGSHNPHNRLRMLKKGISRIAVQTAEISKEDVYIVPVGLNYSNKVNKCATLFVNFGEAINTSQIIDKIENKENENVVFAPIMSKLSEEMEKLILHFENEEFYNLYNFVIYDLDEKKSRFGINLKQIFDKNKKIVSNVTDFISKNEDKSNEYLSDCDVIKEKCEKLELKPYLFHKEKQAVVLPFILLLISFPIFLFGWINNYLPFTLPKKILLGKIKDTQFHPAVNMIVGTFFFAVLWTIQTVIISSFTERNIWLWYLISLPITAWFSFEYYIYFRRFKGKLKYNSLLKYNATLMKNLRQKYLNLKQFKNNL